MEKSRASSHKRKYTKTKNSRKYSVDGNVVRHVSPAYDPSEEKRRKEREGIRRKRTRRNAVRRNREKAMFMSASYVLFLAICVLVGAIFTTLYVREQVKLNDNKKQMTKLQSTYSELKVDNDEKYKKIESSVDLNHIKEVAINEYGMKNARPDQIITYSVESSNYMNQYSKIPEK
ncbi:hypothetical protein [Lachnobacterium bovis]|uniref:Cell division protein FtsL n=1 Tax=Lachnobacterium bovis DSM 14045 TaxID=1122142 RepID=A0A1H3GUX0_9FIRM|nr:hypothetical protein [Lachnobacterium bovis]SDY07123.1 hypothetical protein SAMN02910414_00675 [Lachnobacterium bovis DSM 14045]